MADFSGVISQSFCEDLVRFDLEWQVTRDLAAMTYKYKADFYIDATACRAINYRSGANGAYIRIGDPRQSTPSSVHSYGLKFYTLDLDDLDTSARRLIMSVETDPIPVNNEEGAIPIVFEAWLPYLEGGAGTAGFLRVWEGWDIFYSASHKDNILLSATPDLDPIKTYGISTLDGTRVINSPHTLTIDKGEDVYKHTIEYYNGEEKIVICDKSTALSVSFTPVERLAALNTTGTTLEVPFNIHTYYGNTLLRTRSVVYTFTIPASIKPSCQLVITDGETKDGRPVAEIYGDFVQNHSRLIVKANGTPVYSSDIAEYSITIDGVSYTGEDNEITTALLNRSGEKVITATVTDQRGHTSDPATVKVEVLPYSEPYIHTLSAKRCNANGTENPIGDYMRVVFSVEVSPLNDRNSATYLLRQSKATGADPSETVLSTYTGQHTVENGVHIFEANRGHAYIVELTVTDDFGFKTRRVGGGLAAILMNWLASGKGLCFGGLASHEDTFECQFKFYPSGGYMLPKYTYNNLFIREPNTYYVENPEGIIDCPTTDPFIFEIMQLSEDGLDIMQRITTCPRGAAPKILVRVLRQSSWGSWYNMTTGQSL